MVEVSVVRKLSSLGSRSLAHRKGRSVLTGAGIVLGVAILFGVLVSNATTQKGADELIEGFTGRADVVAGPVGAFDAKLPAGAIEKLRALPGVDDLVPEFGFGTSVPGFFDADDPDDPLQIFVGGIEPALAQKIQDYELESGRFAAPGKNELVISTTLAEEQDIELGRALPIKGRRAQRNLIVVGILKDVGAGAAGDGGGTFTSMQTAHVLQGDAANVFNSASLILEPNTDIDSWIDDDLTAVAGVRLQNAESLAAGFKEFLTVFGTFLTFFAMITLFIGAFLIYLTLSMAVIERTRMYGTLRALGATSRQVRRVVLTEAIALGVVSTFLGLGLGLLLALGLLQLISALFELDIPGLVIAPGAVIAAVLIGIVVTTISALVPARRAGRLAPIEAMKGDYARDTKLSRSWMAGTAILLVSIAMQFAGGNALGALGVIGILLGAVLVVPVLLRPLASLLGRATNRIARGVGHVAVLHLTKERSRSAYTLALVMVVMAMLFATGGLYLSVRAGIDELLDRQFGADLFVQSGSPDDGTLGADLSAQADVDQVSPIRFGFSTLLDDGEREEVFVNTIEPDTYFGVSSFFWSDGDDASAKQALTQGGEVLMASDFARTLGVGRGDDVMIETTKGNRAFGVAGTYAPNPGPPTITMGIKDSRLYLSAGRPSAYVLRVADGADAEAVGDALKTALPARQLEISTAAEEKEEARGQVGTYFQIVYAILAVAAIVGLLGLANTLAMSVLHRFREIGILRALGVTRSQAWRMVLVESATMGLTAFVLSIPLGLLLAFLVIRDTSDGFGFQIPTIYPWAWVPFVAIFAVVIAVIAAIAPGRRAARLHVVTALQYE